MWRGTPEGTYEKGFAILRMSSYLWIKIHDYTIGIWIVWLIFCTLFRLSKSHSAPRLEKVGLWSLSNGSDSISPCFGRVQCFPKANNWDNTTPGRPGLSHTNLLSSRGSPRDWSIHGGGAFHETNLTKMHVMKQHCYRNNCSWIMRWSDAEQFPSHTTLEHLHCQISTLCPVAISSPFAPCRLASRATFQGTHGSGKTQVERHLRIFFWHTKLIIAIWCSWLLLSFTPLFIGLGQICFSNSDNYV